MTAPHIPDAMSLAALALSCSRMVVEVLDRAALTRRRTDHSFGVALDRKLDPREFEAMRSAQEDEARARKALHLLVDALEAAARAQADAQVAAFLAEVETAGGAG